MGTSTHIAQNDFHRCSVDRSNKRFCSNELFRSATPQADRFTLLALSVYRYTALHAKSATVKFASPWANTATAVAAAIAAASRLTCTTNRRCVAAVVGLRGQYVVALQENGRDGNDHSVHQLPTNCLLHRTCFRLSPVPSQK